ncbi:hypothetical protein [Phenylobacterium sp.]|jgi:hypothetical protein|uniref:hypothetical protein n=1 Tax=Phenylobacterium sp. TaxID=1871053 RepID=UPI002E3597CE|nr:hypothetical protein [Phenylobacterium sp.]HEX3363561.1 hypothetical protein [Phenylobacterium sp.]
MSRRTGFLALMILAGAASAAMAQEPPPAANPPAEAPPPAAAPIAPAPATTSVQVETLAAPDAFTTPGRDTGLPATLWRGASLTTVKAVLPLIAARPLSPAAAALARRVLATGAQGPKGADDPAVTGARAVALLGLGDAKAAGAVLARAPGVDRTPELAHAAAESALLASDDARACAVEKTLTAGRDDVYWLRLRTYCQAIGGHPDQAQLTFDLAQAQAKDPVFARLMTAKLAGAGNPGAASLRNGLDYALSHSLGLDLTAAKASPAVAAALSGGVPAEPTFDTSTAAPDVMPLVEALMRGQAVSDAVLQALAEPAGSAEPRTRARGQAALLLGLALSGPLTAETRAQIAVLATPEGKGPLGRDLALESAGEGKLMGEAAMLALWTCAEAGAAGPVLGDRVRIVRALHLVGLEVDARAFALEGLLALK